MKKIIIIGCGMGGLSAAIQCARYGSKVTVIEKNSSAGGKLAQVVSRGYRFDTGPSLLTLPHIITSILGDNSALTIAPLNPICKYFWPNKSVVSSTNMHDFASQLQEKFSEAPEHYFLFLRKCQRLYQRAGKLFLNYAIHHPSILRVKNFWSSLMHLPLVGTSQSLHRIVKKHFLAKEVQQIFMRFATYNGSSPYTTSGMFNVIPYIEHVLGGYVVQEGMHAIAVALEKQAKKLGVVFKYNQEVVDIYTSGHKIGQKSINGVKTNAGTYWCDTLISNMDVYYTKNMLNNKNKTFNTYYTTHLSSSALVLLWGINTTFDFLEIHNIIFSDSYYQEFQQIFDIKIVPTDPTVYINISSKAHQKDAPKGGENWFVMINTPPSNNIDWKKTIPRVKNTILKKIKHILGIDIIQHIVTEKIITPSEYARATHCYGGSLYGMSSNSIRSALKRHANFSYRYRNLYYCGGTVHPGGGIPLALLSGNIAANLAHGFRNNGSLIL